MATPTDPSFPAFSAQDQAEFESAIRSVMEMAAAQDETQRCTFRWKSDRSFATSDRAGKPLSLSQTPTEVSQHEDVQVVCIVTFQTGGGNNETFTPMNEFVRPRAKIQMFDAEYQLIKGATEVLLGENTYKIKFVQPPEGLFGSTFWYIHVQAEDES